MQKNDKDEDVRIETIVKIIDQEPLINIVKNNTTKYVILEVLIKSGDKNSRKVCNIEISNKKLVFRYVNELRELYHDDRSLSMRYKNRFGGKYPPFHFYEERVKIIGGSLNKIGGENLMREAYMEFKKQITYDFNAVRNIEILWDGIGTWTARHHW